MSETKRCPMCGEEILAVAKKCKHCTAPLEKPTFNVGFSDGLFATVFVFALVYDIYLFVEGYLTAAPKDKDLTPALICLVMVAISLFLTLFIRAIRKLSYNRKWSYLDNQ